MDTAAIAAGSAGSGPLSSKQLGSVDIVPTSEQDTVAIVLPSSPADPHGSLRLAARTYRAGFEEIGYRTVTVDLDRFTGADVELLASPRVGLIFSDGGWINGVSAELDTAVQPLVDVLGKRVLVLINDNPCSYWMAPILGTDRANQTTAVLDPDFLTLWGRWSERKGTGLVYVPASPPAVRPVVEPAAEMIGETIDRTDGDRPIPLLVATAIRNPKHYRDAIASRAGNGLAIQLFDGIAEILLSDPLRSVSAACDEAGRTLGGELDFRDKTVRLLVYAVDCYVRNRRRQQMLDRLARHPITLVGDGEGIRLHPDSTLVPPVSHERLLALYAQAQTVVVSPPYSGGISERVVHAMAAGCLVVAPPTRMSDRVFGRDRQFLACAGDFSDLDDCLDRARPSAMRDAMAAEACSMVHRDFSPAASVRRLLDGAAIPVG